MSKQLKLKFKKILKKAEFVQADLVYHEELEEEAKRLFSDAVLQFIKLLPEEDQKKIKDMQASQQTTQNQKIKEYLTQIKQGEEKQLTAMDEDGVWALIRSEEKWENDPHEQTEKNKSLELKKLFRRIAEQTHPDKVKANGFSDKEVYRLEKVFKTALEAYKSNNWYILYSIATELDLPIPDPTQEQMEWIEDDIQNALGLIAKIGNQIAWMWYTGDDDIRKKAMANYFRQAYNVDHPNL